MSTIVSATGIGVVFCAVFLGSSFSASAQNLDIQVGPHGVRPVIRDGTEGGRDACSPGEAMAAARDEGYRHPRIVRVTDRRVVVEGMTEDGIDRISFANRPGCPALQ
jgi:hypothetical protein